MARSRRLHQLPVRLVTGGFILSSGLDKWTADEQTAAGLHGFASSVYPFLGRIEPKRFVRVLAGVELGLGAALLLPIVPAAVAGAGLTAFSAGLLGLYLRTPGMRRGPRDLRPTPEGLTIAKDVWMLGAGAGLLVEELNEGR